MSSMQSSTGEWTGHTSQKFGPTRRIAGLGKPCQINMPRSESAMERKHYDAKLSSTYEWKPSIKIVQPINQSEKNNPMKKIITNFVIVKPRGERTHFIHKKGGAIGDTINKTAKGKKEDLMSEEERVVASLNDWEKNVLSRADPKYAVCGYDSD